MMILKIPQERKRELDRKLTAIAQDCEAHGEFAVCAALHIVAAAMLGGYDVELATFIAPFVDHMEDGERRKGDENG